MNNEEYLRRKIWLDFRKDLVDYDAIFIALIGTLLIWFFT